jgi:hypothetical protein
MKATVARILVFRAAIGAHGERGHRGARPVIRDAADDREARAAIGAVDERIPVPAVRRVEELLQACVARCGVRRDRRCRLGTVLGRDDRKARFATRSHVLDDHLLDCGQRRSVGAKSSHELLDGEPRALELRDHPVTVVAHGSREPQPGGQREDVGAKSDSLHDSGDPDADPRERPFRGRLRRGSQR